MSDPDFRKLVTSVLNDNWARQLAEIVSIFHFPAWSAIFVFHGFLFITWRHFYKAFYSIQGIEDTSFSFLDVARILRAVDLRREAAGESAISPEDVQSGKVTEMITPADYAKAAQVTSSTKPSRPFLSEYLLETVESVHQFVKYFSRTFSKPSTSRFTAFLSMRH